MNVKVSGDNIFKIVMDIKNRLVDDSSELLDLIAEKVVFPSIKENFKVEGRPERWADLAEWTQRERKADLYPPSHPILYRSGELFRNSTTKEGVIYDLGKKELKITCPLSKGARLHYGDVNLPAREFFGLQDNDAKVAETEGRRYITKEIQKIVSGSGLTEIEKMLR